MTDVRPSEAKVNASQQAEYEEGHDYAATSPHLKHIELNAWVVRHLRAEVAALRDRLGRPPRVLEVGAGHGSFTAELRAEGADVVVTEMSRASARVLAEKFAADVHVRVVHHDGPVRDLGVFDAAVYLSVLHHIPDYVAELVSTASDRLGPEAVVISFQDPLWYPRMRLRDRVVAQACFSAWRVLQGDLQRGARSLTRRLLGRLDEDNVSDMSEYHVVRDGVDERAIEAALGTQFDRVELLPYWSTQSRRLQRLGWSRFPANSFGVIARRGRGGGPSDRR